MTSDTSIRNDSEYVDVGDVCRERLRMQCQYGARYIHGDHGFPALGHGLRVNGTIADYHNMTIHQDDVEEFVRRVTSYREQTQI